MARGGKRPGAGRKPGSANKKTREIADKAVSEGITPLEYLLGLMRDESLPTDERKDAAKAAAPYVHPRLNAVDHQSSDGSMTPKPAFDFSDFSDKELETLERLTDKARDSKGMGEA